MKIELELWQAISLLLFFLTACGGMGKLLLTQIERQLDSRFEAEQQARATNHTQIQDRLTRLEESARGTEGEWKRVETKVLEMQLDIAEKYVRREDYIRGQSIVEAKLDGLATKLENLQLRGILDGKHAN